MDQNYRDVAERNQWFRRSLQNRWFCCAIKPSRSVGVYGTAGSVEAYGTGGSITTVTMAGVGPDKPLPWRTFAP